MSQFADDLRSLGFMSYADYLKSPLWAGIRQRVYEQKGRICLDCKIHRATQIHHRQYGLETLKGETLNYLVPVCRQCHREEHGLEPPKPSVATIVIPWNPNQRCPSKKQPKKKYRHHQGKPTKSATPLKLTKAQKRRRNSDRRNAALFKKVVECRICLRDFTVSAADSVVLCERCRTRQMLSQ